MAMSLSRMLCQRAAFNKVSAYRYPNTFQGLRCITMKVVRKEPEPNESYDEKNMRLNREMSPHLTIYKFQLTSMLSISHRITGMALTGYVAAFGLGALVLPHDFSHYITMIEGLQLSAATLVIIKFILAFPVAFHTCNGVRHLLWDSGRFLKMKEVYSTGYAMLGSSVALTTLLALL